MTPFAILPVGNILGEGIRWNVADQAFWWTDIQARRLYRHHLASGETTSVATPERLCCFAFVEDDTRLIAAFETGIAFFDGATGAVDWLHRPEAGDTGRRFNDGGVDRQGRFWAGTMCETAPHGSAALFRLDAAGALTRQIEGVAIANGACWSPDGRRFHFADSPRQTITAYDVDPATGDLANPTLFAAITGEAYPDGATIDAEGHMWSAHWAGGRVVRYHSGGDVATTIALPVTQPTCCAFGGPDLDILAVTSARDELSAEALAAQPLAGHVFLFRPGATGIEEPRYRRGA